MTNKSGAIREVHWGTTCVEIMYSQTDLPDDWPVWGPFGIFSPLHPGAQLMAAQLFQQIVFFSTPVSTCPCETFPKKKCDLLCSSYWNSQHNRSLFSVWVSLSSCKCWHLCQHNIKLHMHRWVVFIPPLQIWHKLFIHLDSKMTSELMWPHKTCVVSWLWSLQSPPLYIYINI